MNGSKNNGRSDSPHEDDSLEQSPRDREEIERFLAQLDEEAIAGEIELQRSLEEARRRPWWTFGIRTFVP